MIDDIYNRIYPSSKSVFVEETERNLEFILKDKINHISRAGFDLLIEVPRGNLYMVVKELKENPELNTNSFQSIAAYKNDKRNFLLVNLKSSPGDLSVLLKIEMPQKEIVKVYINTDISRVVSDEFYKGMEIYNLIAYINRFDWKAGIFPEVCLCSAFEELLQLKLTKRAQYARMLLCELYRISNHIYFISNICNILQYDIAYGLCLLEREKVLRLIETITGSRVTPNFIRIGGARRDIEEEAMLNIRKNLLPLFKNIRRIKKIMMNDFLVIERLKNTCIIPKDIALEYGITGPNLRACGIRYDLRKDKDLIAYKDLSFTVPIRRSGDCLDRVLIRFSEIFQSLKLINQIIDNFPRGPHIKKINLSHLEFQPGVISQGIECPHGLFKIYMEAGKRNIDSLVIKGPSINSLILSEEIFKGSNIEDADLILVSLDISPGEIMNI